MKIGTRAHDYGRQEPETLFAAIAQDGFETVMLAMQKAITGISSYFDVTPVWIERVTKARQNHGLTLEVLGAYMELSLIEESARKQQVAAFLQGMKVAKALGARYVATETTSFAKQPQATPKEAMAALKRSLAEILPEAEQEGMVVALEPVFYHTLSSPELAYELKRDMQSTQLQFVFDAVNLFQPQDLEKQDALWDKVFTYIGEDIVVAHMKAIRVEQGKLVKTDFAHSQIDYAGVFRRLRALNRAISVIREETNPATGAQDAAFLKGFV